MQTLLPRFRNDERGERSTSISCRAVHDDHLVTSFRLITFIVEIDQRCFTAGNKFLFEIIFSETSDLTLPNGVQRRRKVVESKPILFGVTVELHFDQLSEKNERVIENGHADRMTHWRLQRHFGENKREHG